MLIDTHCHLDFPEFDPDRAQVIDRAKKNEVGFIINIGASLRGSQAGVDLSKEYGFIYTSVGIHPHEADKVNREMIKNIQDLSKEAKVVAIGETGLDYYRGISSVENQKRLFAALLELAKIRSLPVIIHCRQAHEDTFKILKEGRASCGVVHCFSGNEEFLKRYLDLGLYVSFTCNLTYKKAEDLRGLLRLVPLERLLLETDAPFLPPEGLRGKRNEPANLIHLAEKVAQVKGIGVEEVARVTSANARELFKKIELLN
ncbi:MAG: TatD family hydrolase [Candidatus Omnitrophota bacterium]